MKRKLHQICTRSKKPRLIAGLPTSKIFVSASQTYNYLMNDPLVDWLKFTERKINKKPNTTNTSFQNFLFKQGNIFEEKVIEYIHENITPVVKISEYITNETIQRTKQEMYKGTPILHSVPVKNNKNGTQGVIDLLVRSDYINKLTNENSLTIEEQFIPAKKLNKNYHYVVIDIKFCTLPFRSDNIHLLNSNSIQAYKAQTLIYTQAIGSIQGYTPNYSFLLGRRAKFSSHTVFSAFHKLGKIDYNTIDNIFKLRTRKAIKWIRDVKLNGLDWSVNPPSRIELYPNMKKDSHIFQNRKKEIANNIDEITNIWNVGVKNRNIANEKGVTRWTDKDCNSKTLNINGKNAPIIDSIISINQQNTKLITPDKIKSNMYNWKNSKNNIFVDFETISDIFSDFSNLKNDTQSDFIFLIGIYYFDNEWKYKHFLCSELTRVEEFRIMKNFKLFVDKLKKPNMYFWFAEQNFWKRAQNRYSNFNLELKVNWCDLLKLFKSEPICIKDCFNFSLKSIAKAMKKHGMISTEIESECKNGKSAIINGYTYYNTKNENLINDIIKYNEFDVKVLFEIMEFLKKNNIYLN